MKDKLVFEWERILKMKQESPYVFRTRLERALNHSLKYANETQNNGLFLICKEMKEKLKYISDQSNQTSDGILNSYVVLRSDMNQVINSL